VIVYGPLAVLVLLFLIGPIRSRTLRQLGRQAPDALAFTVANRREFTDPLSLVGVGTALGARASSLTSGPAVTADNFGVTFWDNTPFFYVGTVDWDRISGISVRDIRTPYRRWTATAIVLDVGVAGATVELPLLSPNGTNRVFASRRESEFLASHLESLRSAAVPA
jgi:hypothetical protein